MRSGEETSVFISEFLESIVTTAESDNDYILSFNMKNTLYHSEILDFDLNAMIDWEIEIISLVNGPLNTVHPMKLCGYVKFEWK